jgi:hypothetical protein
MDDDVFMHGHCDDGSRTIFRHVVDEVEVVQQIIV